MIKRERFSHLLKALKSMPVVALIGPRQVGKTTLALEVSKKIDKPVTYIDLESDADFNKLTDAETYLKRFSGQLLIIDEVQRKPDLFRLLRVVVDERKRNGERTGHFLLLGSASKDLLQSSSESLAGRIRYMELTPFTLTELNDTGKEGFDVERLWLRGGFPDSYLAPTDDESGEWRMDFLATYVERDIPNMGIGVSANQLKRFWKMLAHYHGNQINLSEFGRSLEVSHTTIRNYLDLLTDFYMVRQLSPWSGNVKKRLVKTPKIYIRDSGILHSLIQLPTVEAIFSHPVIGASWEGFVIENIINQLDNSWNYSYYRTATQAEIDLVLHTPDNEIWAVEIKRTAAPKLTRGFYEACKDVKATHKWVISANKDRYPLPHEVEVIGLLDFLRLLQNKLQTV
ncbi:MAG: ATP-binding protein [Bacteroidetes bacterium]|nr:MAG: ATP-binding protein [Bacteroidota bacterium]